MTGSQRTRIKTRFTPADTALADRQWAEWRASRRGLLKSAGITAGAFAMGGGAFLTAPGLRVAAQDGEPKYGGAIAMSLADDDVSTFDPIIPFDNMAIWTMLLIYDQVIRVGPDGLQPGARAGGELGGQRRRPHLHLQHPASQFPRRHACHGE